MQWPLINREPKVISAPRASSTVTSVTVTAGTANVKGTWVTANTIASPGCTRLSVGVANNSVVSNDATIMDIGVQISGNNFVVLPNMHVGQNGGSRPSTYIPIYLPAGSTLIYRIQSSLNAKTVGVYTDVFGGEPSSGLSTPGKFTDYGTDLATSRGTAMTPNATANVKGAYVQLTASTTAPIHRILIGSQYVTTTAGGNYTIDIAVGAPGSERIILADFPVTVNTSQVLNAHPWLIPYAFNIPVGTRISARCSSSASSAANLTTSIIGLTY